VSRRLAFWLVALALLPLPLGRPAPPAASQQTKPAGSLIIKDGRRVSWEGWQFNWSVHPRNGLVLEDVSFQGRSVLKYAGLAEIFVPYNRGTPRPTDFGAGIAPRLIELFPGKDCAPAAGSCLAWNALGKSEGKRVVMMHEEATGLCYVGNLGRAYGKALVLWCAYNLDGYHYISRWHFRDDGSLMPEIGLTGPLQHTGKGGPSPYGSLVGKGNLFAPSHVHNIYYCLDLDVDGSDNNVVEEFNYKQDWPGSPSGKHAWTRLRRETSRPTSATNFRSWRVVNLGSKNALGLPRSYELVPGGGSGIYRGAAAEKFAQAELWVTRHHPQEHPTDRRPLSTILPSYLNGESIDGANVVLWYVLHLHHLPRTEDWPGMRVEWASFTLRPRDFLDASPVKAK
jgi:primary-amine oxidase